VRTGLVAIAVVVLIMGAAPLWSCGTHAGTPPVEHPTTAVDPDGGLPPTPLPSRRGVILPSDVGAGTGPSPGGRDPAAPPGDPGTPAP
jgi:hypothetical protein